MITELLEDWGVGFRALGNPAKLGHTCRLRRGKAGFAASSRASPTSGAPNGLRLTFARQAKSHDAFGLDADEFRV